MPPWTAKTPPASAFETGESVSVLPGFSFKGKRREGREETSFSSSKCLLLPLFFSSFCGSLKEWVGDGKCARTSVSGAALVPFTNTGKLAEFHQARFRTVLSSMETLSFPSPSLSIAQDASPSYDELSMQRSLVFSDSLKDLRNLRSQLYSAAEYFELSYINDVQKQISVDSLKDYTVKALVNTVDHLGSVSCKVNGFLDEKVDEVSGTEFRVSSIEQRVRTCQEFIDHEGISQQSLVISTPRNTTLEVIIISVSVDQSLPVSGRHAIAQCQEIDLPREDRELQLFQPAVRLTIRDRPPPVRKFHSPSPLRRARSSSPSRKFHSPSPSPRPGNLQSSEGRAGSPIPASNPSPLYRYASFSRASTFLNSSNNVQRFPDEPRKSTSVLLHAEREDQKEADQNPGKSKRLLRALLSRRKSRRDDMLYMYLDEY
ncbi:hypothetical protein Taro_027214 [Colocasia esculenta]|uniref:Uncharacterized protein n=1 Tax=Colocasia esculenta TaxID=4460 RepID=A0A843VF52_COLES|nr:hypothetical protein [Colocasia esculenta]